MRRYFSSSMIIMLFVLLLYFPQEVFTGASDGLLLWFQVVIPTLLPFIIISNLMLNTSAIHILSKILEPFLSRLFGVSDYGTFAILTGFLCGYPMGSKVTADMIREGYISIEEGQYLLSFCNNTSPMFIISYLMWQNLKCPELTVPSLIILMASPVIVSFFVRRHIHPAGKTISGQRMHAKINGLNDILDDCIMNGFDTIVRVGGYMMLFSILIALLKTIFTKEPLIFTYLLASLELTNGINVLCHALSSTHLYIASLALTSFGGWCAVAQTHSMIHKSGLKLFPYIIEKLATAVVTSLLAYCYMLL